jgi:hypothetical protein
MKQTVEKVLEKAPGIEMIVLAFLLKGAIPTWACAIVLVGGIMLLTAFKEDKDE